MLGDVIDASIEVQDVVMTKARRGPVGPCA